MDRGAVLKSLPLVLLSFTFIWLIQTSVSGMNPSQPRIAYAPPLPTLALLALSFIELTRGSQARGAIALVVVAIPGLLSIVSEVIN